MKLNKERFLKTELGRELKCCLISWDKALDECRRTERSNVEEYRTNRMVADWCQAQWEVYQMALKQFYDVEYHFSRTDEYFGACTEDSSDWLFKVEKG